MPRPEFSQPGTRNSGEHLAVQSRPGINYQDVSQTANVAAGASESVVVTAPVGAILRLRNLQMVAPGIGAATTGTQGIEVKPLNKLQAIRGTNTYNAELKFDRSQWDTASTEQPGSKAAQVAAMKGLIADETSGIAINYRNDTDGTQTSARTYKVLFEEVSF